MSELTLARLLAISVVLVTAVGWALVRVSATRRRARFTTLAAALGTRPMVDDPFLLRLETRIDGRLFEVRWQHLGGHTAVGWVPGWYLVTETRLAGVSELHSAELRVRQHDESQAPDVTDDQLEVSDCGYPLRPGWATRDVRQSLRDFYGLALPLERLAIEEGVLRHRSRILLPGLDVSGLRSLLARQGAVAAALERSLQ